MARHDHAMVAAVGPRTRPANLDAAGHQRVAEAQHRPVMDPSRRGEPVTNLTFDDGDASTPLHLVLEL
jgi:hypothetical protein